MKYFTILLVTMKVVLVFGQTNPSIKSPSSFFPKEKIKVLVVGAFHFNYPNMDLHKTADEDKIDVLLEPKKTEVTELVQYIKKFKPTKIAIEAFPEWNAIDKFKNYKKGEYKEKRSELYQLGFRIANELKLDTIYSIDSKSFDQDLAKIDSTYIQKLYKDFDGQSKDTLNTMVQKWMEYDKELLSKLSLLDYFKYTNTREYHRLGYGMYLVGDFKLDNNRGADILSIWWYNRNLRIYRKIQEMASNKEDRILVIFGNGHAAILRQLIECSPEFEFIEFDKL